MKRSRKSSTEKDEEFISKSSKIPKTFIEEIGLEILYYSVIVISMLKPSIKSRIKINYLSSVAKMKSSPSPIQILTAELIACQSYPIDDISNVEPTNMELSTSEHNTNVGTSPTRLFQDTPNPDRTADSFLKPTPLK